MQMLEKELTGSIEYILIYDLPTEENEFSMHLIKEVSLGWNLCSIFSSGYLSKSTKDG